MVTLTVKVTDMSGNAISGIHIVWHDRNSGIDLENYTGSDGKASCDWTYGNYDVFTNNPKYAPFNADYDNFDRFDRSVLITEITNKLKKHNFKVTLSMTS
jgi:hypothetical protein